MQFSRTSGHVFESYISHQFQAVVGSSHGGARSNECDAKRLHLCASVY